MIKVYINLHLLINTWYIHSEKIMIIWNDKDSEFYVKKYGNHFSMKIFSQLISYKKYDSILDIGCGGGQLVNSINNNIDIAKIYGIDPSNKMIEISNKSIKSSNIKFLKGYAENLEFKNNSFNIVLVLNSIFHWKNINNGLEEIFRVMKKNSILYIGEERLKDGYLHGNQEIKNCLDLKKILIQKSFKDIVTKNYFLKDEGFYFFSARKEE